jgi:hypothetical protein
MMKKTAERRYLDRATLVTVGTGSTRLSHLLIGARHSFSPQLVGGYSPARKRYCMFCVLSHVETIGMKFDSKHKSSVIE